MAARDGKVADEERLRKQLGETVDLVAFQQILEMDDNPNDREFSRSIFFGFFDQAEETFKDMDLALEARNLSKLSELGHFLKGSSATLGLIKIQDMCENIQRFGKQGKDEGNDELDPDFCLNRIKETLSTVKDEYKDVSKSLKNFFGEA